MNKILLVSILLLIFIGSVHAVITDNLVSYYKLDETSGTTLTDSLGTNNGTNYGVTINQTGIINKAYDFDGLNDYISLANESNFDFLTNFTSQSFTVNIWIKSSGTPAELYNLFGKWDNSGVRGFTIDVRPNGVINAQKYTNTTNKIQRNTGNTTALNGNWNLITVTVGNGNDFHIYLNGVQQSTFNISYGTLSNINISQNVEFGRRDGFFYYNGLLDEAGIWNRVLTSDEIAELYNSGSGLTYPFGVTAVFADFDYVVTGTQVDLNDTSIVGGDAVIDSWEWLIDDVSSSTDQNYSFTGVEATDYNVCLIIQDTTLSLEDSTCQTISISDLTPPITSFESNQITGTTDQNIVLTCDDGTGDGCKTINFRINNGDWNYYTIGDNPLNIIYSGAGDHNIQFYSTDNADNNEATKLSYFPMFKSEDEPSSSRIKLTGVTWYNGYEVTSWQYKVNGTNISGTENRIVYYTTQSNQDLNVCLTTNATDTICKSITTWDTIEPIIEVEINPSTFGFTTTYDINYSLTCYDNFSPIQYKIIWNNDGNQTTIYDALDTNGTTINDTLTILAGQSAELIFSCSDLYNTTSYTSDKVYALLFRLVNEETGVNLTPAQIGTDFNSVRAYTLDGEYSFNFKDANSINTTFFSPTNDLWFEITYKDTANTKLNRQINFEYIDDQNIAICIPRFQTLYQQRFVANSSKIIVLKNNIGKCYVVAGELKYAYDTGYSLVTYTLPLPYYLYTYIDGVKSFLALLDGGVPTQYNIDAIIFSRTGFNIDVGQDTIAFSPLKNTEGIYDTNTIQIYYKSFDETNTKLQMVIKKGTTTLWSFIENTEPNELLVNFYWGGMDVNLDDILTLEVTKTLPDGTTKTSSYYFTMYGNKYQQTVANEWAAIVAILFFLFGITLVAYNKAIGLFGIIICIVSLFFLNMAVGAWWVNLLSAGFVIIMAYIFLASRGGGGIQ